MSLKIECKDFDNVIKSLVLSGHTDYEFALEKIYPLINRFSAQRKLQNPSFYERLRRDILIGCLMPTITLALIADEIPNFESNREAQDYANKKIESGFVLDGMQRLNALNTVKDEAGFDKSKSLFFNLIITTRKDMLLYRMITLNNGQRPMTPRHQIEVLTEELFDFKDLNIDIQTEKERAKKIIRGSFNLSDIAKGYLAFFSGSVHNENDKIISEKMDEIIVGNIMNSAVIEQNLEFQQVLELIDSFSENEKAKAWLKTQNNLIGFCVGIRESYDDVKNLTPQEFGEIVDVFDTAFRGIDAAKVNLGKIRRDLSKKYIEKINEFKNADSGKVLNYFAEETAS